MLMIPRLLLGALFLLSACAPTFEARQDATRSTRPDAPGFLVVGLADEAAVYGLSRATTDISIGFARVGGGQASMTRSSCAGAGLYSTKPCDLTKPARQVLQVPAGEWRTGTAVSSLAVIAGQRTLVDQLPPGSPVRVGPGEVVYIGDYILAADYDAQEITVRRHVRDDAGAARTVTEYPGLTDGPIIYRDPIRRP